MLPMMFKGVLIEQKDVRNIRIKIVDVEGNVTAFPPNDIPELIEDLQSAYNSIRQNTLDQKWKLIILK